MTVVKIIELIGSSPNSWSEAAQNALMKQPRRSRRLRESTLNDALPE